METVFDMFTVCRLHNLPIRQFQRIAFTTYVCCMLCMLGSVLGCQITHDPKASTLQTCSRNSIMTATTYKSTFKVTDWQEDRSSVATPRLTPASIKYDASDIKGTIAAEYLMTYLEGGDASFVFTETVTGDFDGKKGSFITQGQGTFTAATHAVQANFKVVAGTGTGELKNTTGKGSMRTTPSSEYVFELTV